MFSCQQSLATDGPAQLKALISPEFAQGPCLNPSMFSLGAALSPAFTMMPASSGLASQEETIDPILKIFKVQPKLYPESAMHFQKPSTKMGVNMGI